MDELIRKLKAYQETNEAMFGLIEQEIGLIHNKMTLIQGEVELVHKKMKLTNQRNTELFAEIATELEKLSRK